jgi:hypothetical protein
LAGIAGSRQAHQGCDEKTQPVQLRAVMVRLLNIGY